MERWTADLALDARAELGEGPLWDARSGELLWTDIPAGRFHRFDPASGADRALELGQFVSAAVPRAAGGYVLAIRDGFAFSDGESFELAAPVEADRPEQRMNDGACDSRGRFWAGTMHVDFEPGVGSLYRLDPSGAVHTMLRDVTISNGIAWSLDETVMYYVDTPTRRVDAFDFDVETGAIANRRTVVAFEDGAGDPDGIVTDAEGCIWVALWDGWAVRRYAPDGALLGVVELPVANVTKPAFGGAGLDELYVTSAAGDGSHAGAIFVARPGVRGLPPHAFAG